MFYKIFGKFLFCVLIFPMTAFSNLSSSEVFPSDVNKPLFENTEWTTADNYGFQEKDLMPDWTNQHTKVISQGAYIGGGILGTVVGFGTGHAIQSRWLKTGWIHTVLQTGAVAVLGLQAPGQVFALLNGSGWNIEDSKDALALVASLIFLADKIWEIIDVWMLPSSIQIHSARTSIQSPYNSLQLYSQNENQRRHLTPTLNLQWRF